MRLPRGFAHAEQHRSERSPWLRAAVLGANDAIVSTASLMVGVAASDASRASILTAGIAGMVAGAMSMAIGEYVSVGSQRDTEQADIAREREELASSPEAELNELAGIYMKRGLSKELAQEVAKQLTEHDPLAAHLRDELGINPNALAHPFQAAWISAISFALFALLPVLFIAIAPVEYRIIFLVISSLLCLVGTGSLAAYLGNAPLRPAIFRVFLGGLLAMAVSAAVGSLLGEAI